MPYEPPASPPPLDYEAAEALRARITALEEENAVLRRERGRIEVEGLASIAEQSRDFKRVEEALRRQNQLTNAITDNAAVALFIMDEHQHCIFMNPAAVKLTGFTLAEVKGRPLHDVIHHTRPDGSHFPLEECVIDRAFPERAQLQGEEVFVHKDGHFFPVAFTASPILESGRPVGTVIEVQDIAARKLTEMGLARSERRYRSFVEASAQVVWRVNPAAEVDEPIPAWQSYTGQTFSQAQGLGWMNAIRESDRPSTVAAWQKAVNTGGVYEVEYLLLRHDGAWRAVRARGVPVRDDAGTIVEWIGTCIDITLQKQIEEELRLHREELTRLVEERTAQLLHAAEERRRAEDALRQNEKLAALGQLTGGVAHDFNNMLQVVTSGAQLLKQVALTEDRRASILESMIQAGQRARDLTNRLLAFARRQSLAPETFDLNARLADVAELLRRTMRGVQIETDFAVGLWPVHCDPGQLEVALLNIAVNARDAMPNGGTLTLKTRSVTLDATAERAAGEYVRLSVMDTGTGMLPAVLARAFEPFFTTKGVGKGTGLGLPQVFGFAKQSGGDIHIESEIGRGATIVLHLPRGAHGMNAVPGAAVTVLQVLQSSAGKTVLVVDDNLKAGEFAAQMLEELGYHTLLASSGAEAMAMLAEGKAVDAIFSDVVMPGGVDGIELANICRKMYPRVAVVLTTGYSQQISENRAPKDIEVLTKPYMQDELAAALGRAFAGRPVYAANP